MKPYHDLIAKILQEGDVEYNKRTGVACKFVVGEQLKFDLREGFPMLTTRKLPVKNIVGELIGFFRGYTSAKDFRDVGCNFWTANANDTRSWLDNPLRTGTDDLGEVYSANWTNWTETRIVHDHESEENQSKLKYLYERDWKKIEEISYDAASKDLGYCVIQKRTNQLEEAVKKVLLDPSDRRILIAGWNPGVSDFQSLPACHLTYKFTPVPSTGVMHVTMDMRSNDVFLGCPANIVNTSLMLMVMCRLTGYTPGVVTLQIANAHLYSNHFEQARELITREHFEPPVVTLSKLIPKLREVSEVTGVFSAIEPSDIEVSQYHNHGILTAPMAV